ncbi:hypothetical protein L6R52_39335, partial [Myxococcota bacterium]|nr:hypothetical protein [Myxococcota bacterium]
MKGPPGQKPPGSRDEPGRAARPRAELHPGEETQQLEGGALREAVLEAVRAIDAKSGRHAALPRAQIQE